ncbi:hypothetical protein QZH41_004462 [Actinostola sp. cb2023]|nr:hypothetical protein QZH41_004462 [Actinostola sp. cb2023]
MGSFVGHAVPGTMLTIGSIWWLIGALRLSFLHLTSKQNPPLLQKPRNNRIRGERRQQRATFGCVERRTSKIPFEPILKVVLSIVGVLGELFYESQWVLLDSNNDFVQEHLNNYAHVSMYSLFGLSGVVDLLVHYKAAPFPSGLDHVFLALAFFAEGMLFFFHLGGRPELIVRLHTFLYVISFLTSVVLLLEMKVDDRTPVPALSRAFLTSLQGTWFFQIAFVLHGARPWKNSSANVEFVAIAFVWHIFVVAALYLVIFVMAYRGLFAKLLRKEPGVIDADDSDDELE